MNPVLQTIKEKIRKIPLCPGVYLMRGEEGQVIYVGKANRLRTRLRSHFAGKDSSPMSRAMVESIRDLEFIPLKSEEEALILECQYIKEFLPKFNIMYRDDKGYPYLKVTLQEPFPRFIVTRIKKPDGALYLGPYTDAAALRKTAYELAKIFHLRTCSPANPGQTDYDHCLYQMIKWCSAPCVGKISREDYRKSVENACLVLQGYSKDLIDSLEKQMKEAAGSLNFEEASKLRDTIQTLEKIVGSRTKTIHKFKRLSSHADEESRQLGEALGLEKPPQRIEAFDISNFQGKEAVGSMVHFYQGRPDKRFYRRFKIRSVTGIDDFASMQEVVGRRYTRLLEEKGILPDLILIDGGKGQLSSARKILEELGLSGLPVIGLAKRYEEVFTPFAANPIILAKDSGALHLIQRVRDEAHRFAVTYHKYLRENKIRESLLDDIPGLGEKRKQILLQKFGSVRSLKNASIEDIQEASGISGRLAEKIYHFLRSDNAGTLH